MKTAIQLFLALILSLSNCAVSLAADSTTNLNLSPEDRPPIRMSYDADNCRTFYCPSDFDEITGLAKTNESVGIPIANGTSKDFEDSLVQLIKNNGKESLKGSVIYIAGIGDFYEILIQDEHEEILAKYGLDEDVKIKTISMPKDKIEGLTLKSAKSILKRVVNWFPSIKKDYESPQKGEVIAGLTATAVIEVGTVYYLFDTLPATDATLTVLSHAVILAAYTVYTKTMVNWLLRPGSNHVEAFLKQLSLSLPFIINYNIFGQFTPIVEYLSTHTVAETMAAFPTEVVEFASTQSVTMMLQTLFYYVVITRTIGGWMNLQNGVQRSADARVYRKFAESPILFIDAIILAIASGTGATMLMDIGPVEINNGHAMLLALTAAGGLVYKFGMNPSFEVYSWIKNRGTPLALDFLRDSLGVDLRVAAKSFKDSCGQILNRNP